MAIDDLNFDIIMVIDSITYRWTCICMKRNEFVKRLQKQTANYFQSQELLTAGCGYILDKYENWGKNIIQDNVRKFIVNEKEKAKNEKRPFALHKYLHHGLSSQACFFNLLGPIVVSRDFGLMKEILTLSTVKLEGEIIDAKFEYTDRKIFNESKGQPTSVDLYVVTDCNEKIYVEFKFTEAEFGTCSIYEDGNCDGLNPKFDPELCYLHNINRNYINLMNKYDLLRDGDSCQFIEFYQVYRLLLMALEDDGQFLLIHDERNPTFIGEYKGKTRGRYIRFLKMLPPKFVNRVHVISVQSILKRLQVKKCNWSEDFMSKYM